MEFYLKATILNRIALFLKDEYADDLPNRRCGNMKFFLSVVNSK